MKGRAETDAVRTRIHAARRRDRHRSRSAIWSSRCGGAARSRAAAGELGALALDRAASGAEVREALAHWKMPAVEVIYAEPNGAIGSQVAALVPIRRGWDGRLPRPDGAAASDVERLAHARRSASRGNPRVRLSGVRQFQPSRGPSVFARCSRRRDRFRPRTSCGFSTTCAHGTPIALSRCSRGCGAVAMMSSSSVNGCFAGITKYRSIQSRRRFMSRGSVWSRGC